MPGVGGLRRLGVRGKQVLHAADVGHIAAAASDAAAVGVVVVQGRIGAAQAGAALRQAAHKGRVQMVQALLEVKALPYFSAVERVGLITRCVKDLDNVVVDMHDGLLAAYAQEKGAVAIVKGLRAVSDFDYEFQQALTNKKLNPNIETVFITANSDYMYLSSSVVKQVCEFGGDISDFVPPEVHDDIVKRIRERSASK